MFQNCQISLSVKKTQLSANRYFSWKATFDENWKYLSTWQDFVMYIWRLSIETKQNVCTIWIVLERNRKFSNNTLNVQLVCYLTLTVKRLQIKLMKTSNITFHVRKLIVENNSTEFIKRLNKQINIGFIIHNLFNSTNSAEAFAAKSTKPH